MEPEGWSGLYIGLLEIVAALPGSEEDIKDLIGFIAAVTGLETLENVGPLFDSPHFLAALGETAGCLDAVDAAQGYSILKGLAHISAVLEHSPGERRGSSNSGAIDSEAPQADDVSNREHVSDALGALLNGILESPDLQESIRYLLGWFFLPDRASRLRSDLALLLGSGAVEELLTAASRIGVSNCEPLESSRGEPLRGDGP